jgi:hypothetical protein
MYRGVKRNLDTEENRKMWDNVDKAAESAPQWIKDRISKVLKEKYGAIESSQNTKNISIELKESKMEIKEGDWVLSDVELWQVGKDADYNYVYLSDGLVRRSCGDDIGESCFPLTLENWQYTKNFQDAKKRLSPYSRTLNMSKIRNHIRILWEQGIIKNIRNDKLSEVYLFVQNTIKVVEDTQVDNVYLLKG